MKSLKHIMGLSCLCGSTLLQLLVFFSIFTQGYFLGVEETTWILIAEMALSVYAVPYSFFLLVKYVKGGD